MSSRKVHDMSSSSDDSEENDKTKNKSSHERSPSAAKSPIKKTSPSASKGPIKKTSPSASKNPIKKPYNMSSSSDEDERSKNESSPVIKKSYKRFKGDNDQDIPNPCKSIDGVSSLGFYLTKVNGISSKFNDENIAADIKDILSPKHGKLLQSAQFSYVFDVEWLTRQYPECFRTLPVLLVHGEQRESKKALEKSGAPFKNISFCRAQLPIPFGTHHTKMMLLLYEEGLRIVIHTSNLVQQDWFQKSQAMWRSPLFPKLKLNQNEGTSKTNFKEDLIQYLEAYNCPELTSWISIIKEHNLSTASVILIGSVPGRHLGSKKQSFGLLKLKKVLTKHLEKNTAKCPLIAQFSSIGSLGTSENQWLCTEFLSTLAATNNSSILPPSSALHLIYPTVENVRKSLEGYPAGASLPYSYKTEHKQPYLRKFFCHWKAERTGRSEASPHIKTYMRVNSTYDVVYWFLVTSANLSKAAWGNFEKKNEQFFIRSYELGVLFLPEMFGFKEFSCDSDQPNYFPIPYDLPPKKYSHEQGDEPWTWDAPHIKAPDRHGHKWCPP